MNAYNLIKAIGPGESKVEVLANSEAAVFYTGKGHTKDQFTRMQKLNDAGVVFKVCNNSLEAHEISKDEVIPFVRIVPVGVLELILVQDEGYAYIKV